MRVAKTKALISFMVTVKLICVFVFAYAKSWFSHNEALMITMGDFVYLSPKTSLIHRFLWKTDKGQSKFKFYTILY